MSIIAHLGSTLNEYNAQALFFLEQLTFYCPFDGCKLTPHASYTRGIKETGESISIHRYKCTCKGCNHTVAILPDFLQPHKQYSAQEINNVLIEADTGVPALGIDSPASITTIRRWISQYKPILDEKISHLKAACLQLKNFVVNETALNPNSPMETIHRLLRLLPHINHSNSLGAAFIYAQALAIPT